MEWERQWAGRMKGVRPSPIMELIKVLGQRRAINFASGLPDPDGFPLEGLREAAAAILDVDWRAGLQYGEAEGYRPLREWVAGDLSARGVPTKAEQVLITSGSQQGIDLVGRALLQPGDIVVTENPSYLAALQVFGSFEATVRAITTDDEGIDVESAAAYLRQPGVKLLYLMANHQNPSGITLASLRRRPILEAARRAGVPVLADEAYLHLRYDPGVPQPLAAADPEAPVITLGTFSKTIAPGLRVAYMAGPPEFMSRMGLLKQITDLHTSSYAQRLVYRYAASGEYPAHVARLCAAFRKKRDCFLAALETRLGGQATWTRPAGGMFLLLRLPEGRSATTLLTRALDHGVAYVPGASFFPGGDGQNTMRLNFLSPALAEIQDGVERLARAIVGD